MLITEIFCWWYRSGWLVFLRQLKLSLSNIVDFFSMSDLLRTLFQPFRQISASHAAADSSLELKFRTFLDRLISRIVGFFSRLVLLLAGTIIILLGAIFSLILLILWPFLPLAPLAGIILTIFGVIL